MHTIQRPVLELRKRRDFGEIIADTFQFFRQNFRQLLKASLYIAGPFLLIGAIFFSISYVNIISRMDMYQGPGMYYVLNMGFGILFIVVGMAMLYAVMHDYVKLLLEGHRKEEIQVADVWKLVRRDVWKAIGVNVVLAIMFGLIFFVIVFTVSLLGVLGVLFAFFAIIGCAILFIRVSLAHPAALLENYPVFDSIGRSWEMTKNMFWMTLGTAFILGIVVGLFSYIFYIPLIILMVVVGLNGGGSVDPTMQIVIISLQAGGYFVMFLGYMVPAMGLILQYLNCVERKEGHGLLSRIDNMELGADESHWGQEEY